MENLSNKEYTFEDLVKIINVLRSKNGCPWDIQQTHESLREYLIEETYEVLDAINSKDKNNLCEELGDLLLQVVFHSQISKENNDFTINDVITCICKKMIGRHVHVFGDIKLNTSNQVLDNWDKIKKKEKQIETQTCVLKNVPAGMPALMRSYQIQHKASKVGFEWDAIEKVIEKIDEEITELKSAYLSERNETIKKKTREEIGDVIFSIVNFARFLKINPEFALTETISKFITRFEYIEKKCLSSGRILEEMNLEEMDQLWNEAKSELY